MLTSTPVTRLLLLSLNPLSVLTLFSTKVSPPNNFLSHLRRLPFNAYRIYGLSQVSYYLLWKICYIFPQFLVFSSSITFK